MFAGLGHTLQAYQQIGREYKKIELTKEELKSQMLRNGHDVIEANIAVVAAENGVEIGGPGGVRYVLKKEGSDW